MSLKRSVTFSSKLPHPVAKVFYWFDRPSNYSRLETPFSRSQLVWRSAASITKSTQVHYKTKIGPLKFNWKMVYSTFIEEKLFTERQTSGLFLRYIHKHRFSLIDPKTTHLKDCIEYTLPFGKLFTFLVAPFIDLHLKKVLAFQHFILRHDLMLFKTFKLPCEPYLLSTQPSSPTMAKLRSFLDPYKCSQDELLAKKRFLSAYGTTLVLDTLAESRSPMSDNLRAELTKLSPSRLIVLTRINDPSLFAPLRAYCQKLCILYVPHVLSYYSSLHQNLMTLERDWISEEDLLGVIRQALYDRNLEGFFLVSTQKKIPFNELIFKAPLAAFFALLNQNLSKENSKHTPFKFGFKLSSPTFKKWLKRR